MSEKKIKACPFCGGKVRVTRGLLRTPFCMFQCLEPSCCAIVSFNNAAANTKPIKAVDNWNRRETNE